MLKRKSIIILVLMVVLMMIMFLRISVASSNDFRNVNWGMSKKEVMKNETAVLFNESDDFLSYTENVMGYDMGIAYKFANDKLTLGAYLLPGSSLNYYSDYLGAFAVFKLELEKKYGEIDYDEIIWENDFYRDDSDKYGLAIAYGHLRINYEWYLDNKTIRLAINGHDGEINIGIIYKDPNFEIKRDGSNL